MIRRAWIVRGSIVGLAMGSMMAGVPDRAPQPDRLAAQAPPWQPYLDAMLAGNPYYATTLWGCSIDEDPACGLPAIVAFNDTPAHSDPGAIPGRQRRLAGSIDVGTVNGLAWDGRRRQLYAAAYHHALHPFRDREPGGIYRFDLDDGAVARWAVVPAGADVHDAAGRAQKLNEARVGRASLGDIELGVENGRSVLFVVNLADRKIHRLSVPDGARLGSFDHGAAGTPWAANARPFGLAFRDGWLFHGVVDSREDARLPGDLGARVYRSRPDGGDMREVLALDLRYPRVPPWTPWTDAIVRDDVIARRVSQPMLVDIEFRPEGDMVLGFRDRLNDILGNWSSALPNLDGDVLLARRTGPDRWQADVDPEPYDDTFRFDESVTGALAAAPGRDTVVAGIRLWNHVRAAAWFDNASGRVAGPADGEEWLNEETYDGGDIEALVLLPPPTATPTPTATAVPTATPTPTPAPRRFIHLPILLDEHCPPRRRHVDVALVVDVSTSMERPTAAGRPKLAAVQDAARTFVDQMRLGLPDPDGQIDQVALVGFNDTAWTAVPLAADAAALRAAIDALPARMASGTRLDLALDEASVALSDAARRRPSNLPVVILLTDGLPSRVPTPAPGGSQEDTVLAAAARAKAIGIAIYTIGVGRPDAPDPADRINADLLRAVASAPEQYVEAPDAEALAAIYRALAVTITDACPGGRHDWGRGWP